MPNELYPNRPSPLTASTIPKAFPYTYHRAAKSSFSYRFLFVGAPTPPRATFSPFALSALVAMPAALASVPVRQMSAALTVVEATVVVVFATAAMVAVAAAVGGRMGGLAGVGGTCRCRRRSARG